MGIRIEKIRQKELSAVKTNSYYNGVLGADLESPVNCPDILVETGRQLDKFGVENRKECVKKNLGIEMTPSQLFSKAGLKRKVK